MRLIPGLGEVASLSYSLDRVRGLNPSLSGVVRLSRGLVGNVR